MNVVSRMVIGVLLDWAVLFKLIDFIAICEKICAQIDSMSIVKSFSLQYFHSSIQVSSFNAISIIGQFISLPYSLFYLRHYCMPRILRRHMDINCLTNKGTGTTFCVRLEQQDSVSSLLSTIASRISAASNDPARTRQVLVM